MGKFISTLVLSVGMASVAHAATFEQRSIGAVGWQASYLGCLHNPVANSATYSYLMSVTSWEKDLSHWVLVLDANLVPIASSGGNLVSFGRDPTTNTYGFKWDDGQRKGTTATYSVTLAGPCNPGLIQYAVKGGTYYARDTIMGPVPGPAVVPPTYDIGGVVFIDANKNGAFDMGEPVAAGVNVVLRDAQAGEIGSINTDTNGRYLFPGNNPGQYEVLIPAVGGLNNEQLAEYAAAPNTVRTVTLHDRDLLDNNFGFIFNLAAIRDDINTSDPDADGYSFAGIGRTIGFWKHQHSVAIKGKGAAQVDAVTLNQYLVRLETLWLPDPFNFGTTKIANSLLILSSTSPDARALLLKQLVATELNHLAGLGLTDAMQLQSLIIHYAEFLAANAGAYSREELLLAKEVLDAINNSGH